MRSGRRENEILPCFIFNCVSFQSMCGLLCGNVARTEEQSYDI